VAVGGALQPGHGARADGQVHGRLQEGGQLCRAQGRRLH
jgi:hypothetical protein